MIISVDFDGTLALGDTSDIPSMKANTSLVKILNQIHKDGNEINIITARGAKSCKTQKDREKKYFKVIENWLKENKVCFNRISFKKEYADIYLDDKCINIKSSLSYHMLDSIFTKNKVRRVNDFVIKRSETSVSEYNWYKFASKIINTAEVLSYDRDTITTKYIRGETFNNPDLSINILNKFKNEPSLSNASFYSYIERIESHASQNSDLINVETLVKYLKKLNVPNTFNHGDFSIENMIQNGADLYLIDPIFSPKLFQSYYLDAAKHLFSILYYNLDYDLYKKCLSSYLSLGIPKSAIEILMCSESIRVCTYKKSMTSISNNLISTLSIPEYE